MSTTDEKVIILKKTPLFAHLEEDQLRALAAISDEVTYVRGAVIATQGDEPDALFLVAEGRVAMQQVEQTRRQQESIRRLATFGPHDCFGELSVFDGEPYAGDLVATRATKLFSIGKPPLLALLAAEPALALGLLRAFCLQLRQHMAQSTVQVTRKPKTLMDLYDSFDD